MMIIGSLVFSLKLSVPSPSSFADQDPTPSSFTDQDPTHSSFNQDPTPRVVFSVFLKRGIFRENRFFIIFKAKNRNSLEKFPVPTYGNGFLKREIFVKIQTDRHDLEFCNLKRSNI